MGLEVYLNDPGTVPGIGPETGGRKTNGISKYTSPHGSSRYVAYVNGVPVSALQVVSRDGIHASIANVYTLPRARRQGWANTLLARAHKDFSSIEHSKEEMLSPSGRAWRDAKRNPIPTSALWLGSSALTALGIVLIIEAIRTQQQEPAGYRWEPPISYNT
jgi:hypothetical protein